MHRAGESRRLARAHGGSAIVDEMERFRTLFYDKKARIEMGARGPAR
jgi:hypothetical protein